MGKIPRYKVLNLVEGDSDDHPVGRVGECLCLVPFSRNINDLIDTVWEYVL
jgi:hypothetical protein